MNFDRNKVIALSFLRGGVETTVRVKFPSDELLVKRAKRLPQHMRSLHGGRTEAISRDPDREIAEDLALFEAIKVGDDPIEEHLALKTIEILDMGQTREMNGSNGVFEVELEILQGAIEGDDGLITVHRLLEPTVRQQRRFAANSSTLRTLPGGNFQLTENLNAAAFLYDDIFDGCTGYEPATAAAVPISHKVAVISRLMSELSGATAAEMATGE